MINSQSTICYLALGSNLGDRQHNLDLGLEFLSDRIKIEKMSPVYETAPVGEVNQPPFLNMVLRVSTRVPIDTPRPIDIDILFYGDQIVSTPPNLIVPHPRLHERAFVLVPLADIAPDLVHPVSKKNIRQLLEEVQGKEGVVRWGEVKGKE